MLDQLEWERRIVAVGMQLEGLSVGDAGAVLTASLLRLINTAPMDLQQILTMKIAAMMIGTPDDAGGLH